MINRTYYIDDATSNAFISAMGRLAAAIPCFLELVDIDTIYIEFRQEDVVTVERYLAPYV